MRDDDEESLIYNVESNHTSVIGGPFGSIRIVDYLLKVIQCRKLVLIIRAL